MDVVAESVIEIRDMSSSIEGLEFTYEPKHLRFFQARFRPVTAAVRVTGLAPAGEEAFS
jgi:tryptophanase